MKKIYIIGALAVAGVAFTSCDDFLNDNRYPESQQTVNSLFWSNSVNVQNQINYFYNEFSGYGNRSGSGSFYWSWLSDDQCGRNQFADWTFKTVPGSSTSWSAPYVEIRRANLVIAGVEGSSLTEAESSNFLGIARLYRALMYYQLVSRYGDVPLVKIPLDPDNQAELFGPRTPRNEVMDFVLEDLNYAVNNIAKPSSKFEFSVDLAQAIKADICLFEASYARYHAKDEARATKFYGEVVNAGEAIASKYPINPDFTANYKSLRVAGGGYDGISANSEIIFAKAYEQGVFMHSIVDYSSASDGIAGLTKDAFDDFLFIDGRPAASTTHNNTDAGVWDSKLETIDMSALFDVRDQRLAMSSYNHVCAQGASYQQGNTASMWSMTGYGVSKYNNFTFTAEDAQTANKGYNCAPLYWGARLYLAIAEAKAELGTLSDADVTTYIKPLWDRAGIDTSNLNKAWLENMNDPKNDMNVSSLIWEIRRCRRCELMMDDNIRYWDLVRWHQLDKIAFDKNPDAALGANISAAPQGKIASATKDGYMDCSYGMPRNWNDKYYFYPVPSVQITLNQNLTQNPGW